MGCQITPIEVSKVDSIIPNGIFSVYPEIKFTVSSSHGSEKLPVIVPSPFLENEISTYPFRVGLNHVSTFVANN